MLTAEVGPTWRRCPLSCTTSNCTSRNLGPSFSREMRTTFSLRPRTELPFRQPLILSTSLRETLFSQGDYQRPQEMRSGLFFVIAEKRRSCPSWVNCISYETLAPYSKAPIRTLRFATTDGWTRVARCLGDWIEYGALWRVVARTLKLTCYTTNYVLREIAAVFPKSQRWAYLLFCWWNSRWGRVSFSLRCSQVDKFYLSILGVRQIFAWLAELRWVSCRF